jgi:hypothetical protein
MASFLPLAPEARRIPIFREFRLAMPNPTPGENQNLRHSGLNLESKNVRPTDCGPLGLVHPMPSD